MRTGLRLASARSSRPRAREELEFDLPAWHSSGCCHDRPVQSRVLTAALFYRLLVATLRVIGAIPIVGSILGASSAKGTDTFRLAVGRLFCWSVSVNRQLGTLTGSIQIDGARRWGTIGVLAACVAAVAVPMVASVLMPAALVVVGLDGLESRHRSARQATR